MFEPRTRQKSAGRRERVPDDRDSEGRAPAGEMLALQHTLGNRAFSTLVQRAKGDKHAGTYVKRPSDGSYMIKVDAGLRALWFKPPDGHGLVQGQAVTFVEGDNGAVTELNAGAAPKSYVLFDGKTAVTDADIAKGDLHAIAGRTTGDVELAIETATAHVVIHIHPYAGSGGTPTGGAVQIGSAWSMGNASQELVKKIAERPDFKEVVAAAAPRSRAAEAWHK